jgi:hypothetical protein
MPQKKESKRKVGRPLEAIGMSRGTWGLDHEQVSGAATLAGPSTNSSRSATILLAKFATRLSA